MTLAALMICDNRREYTEESLNSLLFNMPPTPYRLFVHDDSCDEAFGAWLYDAVHSRFFDAEILTAPAKRGFSGSIRAAWDHIYEQQIYDFVFATENDFTFNGPIPIGQMMDILEQDHTIGQVALLRQPWSTREKRAGGVIPSFPEGTFHPHRIGHLQYLRQNAFWTTNPSLIPAWVLGLGWPDVEQSEGMFSIKLREMGIHFAYYGALDDGPRITHIGYDRVSEQGGY